MKAHINMDKTQEEAKHRQEIEADAGAYLDWLIEQRKISDAREQAYIADLKQKEAQGWVDNTPIIQCETIDEYDRRCNEAMHVEECIDESKFPPYDPSCGLTYEDYLANMAMQAESDMAFIQRYGVSGEVISEYLKKPDDYIWDTNPQSNTPPVIPIPADNPQTESPPSNIDDCPFDLDSYEDSLLLTEEEGMVSASDLPPEVQRQMCGADPLINKNYVERKSQEMASNFGLESTLFRPQEPQVQQNPYGMPMQNMYYNQNPYMYQQNPYGYNPYMQQNPYGMPMQNMYYNQNPYTTGTTFQFGNMVSQNKRNRFGISEIPDYYYNHTNAQNEQYEMKDGYMVRKITPYFSVIPGGNKYAPMYAQVYYYPQHQQYEEIKSLYEKEELGHIRLNMFIARSSRPEGVSKEEFDAQLRAMYDPYSVEYAKAESERKEAELKQKEEAVDPFKGQIKTFTCHIKIKNGVTDEVIVDTKPIRKEMHFDRNTMLEAERELIMKQAQMMMPEYEKMNFYAGVAKRQQEMERRFPNINEVSVEDFFGKSELSQQIYDFFVTEPEERRKRRNNIDATYDTYRYLQNIGWTYRYRMDTHTTAGEDIIRKCGLKPGDPLYDYYMKETERANYMAVNYFNPDGTPKHNETYDARKRAYELAIEYPTNSISPGKPCCDVPPYILNTLPQDVLVELGYASEPVLPPEERKPKHEGI